ncbi:MAG: hypothetical protein N3B17_05265, partial [Chlorobi bacterium]|nr:hypothetical protein [Chlorobiota bacterium]
TWSLDSVDIGRVTVGHLWSDTVTVDTVRGRVGRFDSLLVGKLHAAVPFDSIKSGVNENQTLSVGNGSVLSASGTGIVRANRVNLTGPSAPLETNGSAGSSGQLLKSKGSGQTPEWTWSLDSVDIGRVTVGHLWSDTVTVDTVRGRVGRFDSLLVEFMRGDTAYISSLRIDSLYVGGGLLHAAVPFDSIKSGVNENQTLSVGNGSVLSASGTGIVRANAFRGSGSVSDAVDLATAEVSGVLPVTSGGTGTSAIGSAGSVAYSNGSTLAYTGVGTSGQVLVSAGSGTPQWQTLDASSVHAWSLTGNSGTSPSANFLGTTDNQPLAVRTNNTERVRVDASGNVGIGTTTPTNTLHVNASADPVRFEGIQTDATPTQVLTVAANGVVKKANVSTIVGGTIIKGIYTPGTSGSHFTISPGQDIQAGAVVVVTVYGSSSGGVVGAMVTNINAGADTFSVATAMAIDNTYAIHYIIINP